MEAYAAVLNYAIPAFLGLILIEYVIGRLMGVHTIRVLDTVSSLSSGLTNIIKDVLGLTVIIVSYGYMVDHLAIFHIESTITLYVLAFIGKDFVGYWSHRWEHKINLLWNRHIIHHSSEEFNLACALRQNISIVFGVFFFLYVPMAVLGVPQQVVAIVAPIHLFMQFWYHTVLIKKMGILEYIIVTPSHHRVHHAINDEYIDKNFSQVFIFWDRLFGTFQEELDDVPAVYGTKKPADTWNPIIINFQHLWQLGKDAVRTKNWTDKLRIWVMPTGWRPEDVKEKYPIDIVTDPYSREKYDVESSSFFKTWHVIQLFVFTFFTLHMFAQIGQVLFSDLLVYALFIVIGVFGYTTLMDKYPLAYFMEFVKLIYCLIIITWTSGWFGLENIWLGMPYVVLGYCLMSLFITIYFLRTEPLVKLPKLAVS